MTFTSSFVTICYIIKDATEIHQKSLKMCEQMSESSLNISKYVEVDTWVSVCDSWEAGTQHTHRQTVCLLTLLYYSLHSGGTDNDPVNPRHILMKH